LRPDSLLSQMLQIVPLKAILRHPALLL
jgi:hypothetical protein